MKNILITGATGNVGTAVLAALANVSHGFNVVAGLKDPATDSAKVAKYATSFRKFDFTDSTTYAPALRNCDLLFLLRPPQISDTKKYFKPLIETAQSCGVRHIVFLSVQGVEKSSIIPHHKIEKMIVESKIPYTFLRPAYFMQNFTSTLHDDLATKKLIFLPAGKAKFTLIDVRDVGQVAAEIMTNLPKHLHKAYELTCSEKLTFQEMADKLSAGLGIKIKYESPNLWRFFWQKRRENVPAGYILVLIMLHYLPRFQAEPNTTDCVETLTGKKPHSFEQFVADYKTQLQ